MPKSTTSSFITEIPVKTGSHEEAILQKRFFAANQQYNALLGETLKRLERMRKDERYGKARELYRQEEKKAEEKTIFKKLAEDHGYREYDLYGYCTQWNEKGSSLSIGARISQKIAKRACEAVDEYRKGIRGKPRFKGARGLNSIEDNSIDANLRLKEDVRYYFQFLFSINSLPNEKYISTQLYHILIPLFDLPCHSATQSFSLDC